MGKEQPASLPKADGVVVEIILRPVCLKSLRKDEAMGKLPAT
jgi:hypothetical protein